MPSTERHATWTQTYEQRATIPGTSPLAVYLLHLMVAKKTNLAVSADVSSTRELLQLAEEVGDQICVFKTHADTIDDFGQQTTQGLMQIARRKGFVIFEDRKFGDIGSTVQKQYTGGPLQIVRWANIVNAHIFPGPSIVTALSSAAIDAVAAYSSTVETSISGPRYSEDGNAGHQSLEESNEERNDRVGELDGDIHSFPDKSERKQSVVSVSTTISTKTESARHHRNVSSASNHIDSDNERRTVGDLGPPPMARSLLLIAQMSSAGNLMNDAYAQECVTNARKNKDFVMGFIAQTNLNSEPQDNFLTFAPGVRIDVKGDAHGQQYNEPDAVIRDAGVDIAIVGRGIISAQDRLATAKLYREKTWAAYEARVGA